ncbi:transketolase [Sphingomonas sp. MMS12-HWE2-04]|uniref:transketolase n=1 Tax=Sphingomonas sp. MMS12-HWE2-04 TaxID=3234199 RepID=UPI00384B7F5F
MRFDPQQLRRTVLDMAYAGRTVHIGCAFSIIDIMAVLYRSHLRVTVDDPRAADRDYLVLSKGHGVMAQYACMRELGWITDDQISGYCSDGSQLKGLSDSRIPGLEVTSGSLGHGLSVGVGIALGARRRGTDQRVFAIVGDGEMNEGPIWEAMLFAGHNALGNLTVVVDENGWQAMGRTQAVLQLGSLEQKFESFGFDAVTVDGHDEQALDVAFEALRTNGTGRPKAIVARTIKGKGVSFMEDDNIWHYTRLDDVRYQQAIAELEAAR